MKKNFIRLNEASVEFIIKNQNSKSLKKQIVNRLVGGKINHIKPGLIKVTALDKINIDFLSSKQKGEIIGLVGHNGSGKSTLLKLIGKIYTPTSGFVETCGDISGFFEPNAGMSMESTGLENIYLKGLLIGVEKSDIDKNIDRIFKFSGLESFINNYIKTYSTGMIARLSFAISLLKKSEILLIDEHLGTGDKNFAKKVQKKFDEMLEQSKITIIATHDEEFLKKINAKIYLMEKGKIINH